MLLVEPAAAAGDEGGPDPRLGAGGAPARCRASAAPGSRMWQLAIAGNVRGAVGGVRRLWIGLPWWRPRGLCAAVPTTANLARKCHGSGGRRVAHDAEAVLDLQENAIVFTD